MLGTLLYLAEATAEAEGGFGLNTDILESNLINLLILIGVLLYYGRKIVGNILSERKDKIAEQIEAAAAQERQAAQTLKQEQQKLAQAQQKAEKIIQEARENAEKAKAEIIANGEREVERIRATAVQDLNSEQERAIASLRQRVAELAIERAEAQLNERLNDEAQNQLIDRSIAQLQGGG